MISLRSKITRAVLADFFLNHTRSFYVNELSQRLHHTGVGGIPPGGGPGVLGFELISKEDGSLRPEVQEALASRLPFSGRIAVMEPAGAKGAHYEQSVLILNKAGIPVLKAASSIADLNASSVVMSDRAVGMRGIEAFMKSGNSKKPVLGIIEEKQEELGAGALFAALAAHRLADGKPVLLLNASEDSETLRFLNKNYPGAYRVVKRFWQYLTDLYRMLSPVEVSA